MKQQNTLFILLVSLLWVVTGCTSYSNGPKLSLRSTGQKMDNTWKVKEAVKFGSEITSLYEDGYFIFKKDGRFSTLDTKRWVSLPPFTQDTALPIVANGEWNLLENDKFEIIYTYTFTDPYDNSTVYNDEVYEQWNILRLTEQEFWIKNDSMSFRFVPN